MKKEFLYDNIIKVQELALGKGGFLLMDNNNMEYDYYPEEPEKKKGFTVGKIFKYLAIALVVLVYALVFFRIAISKDTKLAKSFIWTEESASAYSENGGLTVYTQKLEGYTLRDDTGNVIETVNYEELSEDGLFQVSNFMYVEETGEIIITVRYNDNCEELYCDKYSLDPKAGEIFVFELSGGGETYSDYTFVTDERFVYHYRRLIFSGVELENAGTLSLIGYCVGNPDREKPVVNMTIYDSHLKREVLDLEKYLPAKVNGNLKTPPYVKFD